MNGSTNCPKRPNDLGWLVALATGSLLALALLSCHTVGAISTFSETEVEALVRLLRALWDDLLALVMVFL